MPGHRLVVLPAVQDRIRHLAPDLKRPVREALKAIESDPTRGEALQRALAGYLKFKVRRYRIVYRVNARTKAIFVVAFGHRRSVYEEASEALNTGRRSPG